MKQQTIEEAAKENIKKLPFSTHLPKANDAIIQLERKGFIKGATWQKEQLQTIIKEKDKTISEILDLSIKFEKLQLEWEKALVSLTPSGSEFCGDSKACVNFVRDLHESRHTMLCEQVIENKNLKSVNKELSDSHSELLILLREIELSGKLANDEWLNSSIKAAIEKANNLTK